MKLSSVRLCVDDIKACYAFYRDVMKLRPRFDATDSVYAEFDLGGTTSLALFDHKLMQQAIGVSHDDAERPAERVVVAFEVESVDTTFAELASRGATVARPPTDQPHWMLRVAHVRDPAGNLIEIHEALKK